MMTDMATVEVATLNDIDIHHRAVEANVANPKAVEVAAQSIYTKPTQRTSRMYAKRYMQRYRYGYTALMFRLRTLLGLSLQDNHVKVLTAAIDSLQRIRPIMIS